MLAYERDGWWQRSIQLSYFASVFRGSTRAAVHLGSFRRP